MMHYIELRRIFQLLPLVALAAQPVNCRGDLLLAHFFEGGISRLNLSSGETNPFVSNESAALLGLFGPSGLASDAAGNVYVSSQFTGEVLYFDAAGTPLPSPIDGGRDGLFASFGQGSAPGLIRFGPSGDLYVADAGVENIHIVDADTGLVAGQVLSGGELAMPGFTIGMTFDDNGDILIGRSSPIFQGSIFRVDDSGTVSDVVPPDAGVLLSVNSMLVGPSGELLAVDLFGNQIAKFDDTSGSGFQSLAIPPPIPDPLPVGADFGSNFPSDVLLDSDGTLLVGALGLTNPASGGDNRGAVHRFNLDGTLLETIIDGISPVSAILQLGGVTGDYDNSGQTEQGDLDLVLLHWGDDVAGLPASWVNQRPTTGQVDQEELDSVLLNWGAGASPNNGAAAVPEPSAMVLCVIVFLAVIRLRND